MYENIQNNVPLVYAFMLYFPLENLNKHSFFKIYPAIDFTSYQFLAYEKWYQIY